MQVVGACVVNLSASNADFHFVQPQDFPAGEPQYVSLLAQGRELHQRGELAPAFVLYQQAIALKPYDPQGWHLSGTVKFQQGELADAVGFFQRAVELEPVAGYYRNLGEVHHCSGNYSSAIHCFEQALRLDPFHVGTWTVMSETLLAMGEITPSLDCLGQALRLDPFDLSARFLLANTLKQMGDLDAAAPHYRFVLERQPRNVAAAVNLASLLRSQGEVSQALQLLRNVLRNGAHNPSMIYDLAKTLAEVGEFEEARNYYRSAIAAGHSQPAKLSYHFARITKFSEKNREEFTELKSRLSAPMASDEEAVYAHFALAKAHDDLREYEQAFRHYREANLRVNAEFDSYAHREEVTRTIECWSREFVETRREWGVDSATPVFIVGMPRSGTTLVELLLSSHPEVQLGGARETMPSLLAEHAASVGSAGDLIQGARLATQADLHDIAMAYLLDVTCKAGKSRLTDKLSTNFLRLGWIATCFPEAAIIHCRRDPRDVCLSAYFQHFSSPLPYAYDLQHLASFYRDYERIMSHWHDLFPGRILDVRYEELVESPEKMAVKVISHCGLTAHDDAAKGRELEQLHAASIWQGRPPVYPGSHQSWRNYQPWIQPLLDEFGDQ